MEIRPSEAEADLDVVVGEALVACAFADRAEGDPGADVRGVSGGETSGHGIGDLFESVVHWGRYGQPFHYDATSDELSLYAGREEEN